MGWQSDSSSRDENNLVLPNFRSWCLFVVGVGPRFGECIFGQSLGLVKNFLLVGRPNSFITSYFSVCHVGREEGTVYIINDRAHPTSNSVDSNGAETL